MLLVAIGTYGFPLQALFSERILSERWEWCENPNIAATVDTLFTLFFSFIFGFKDLVLCS